MLNADHPGLEIRLASQTNGKVIRKLVLKEEKKAKFAVKLRNCEFEAFEMLPELTALNLSRKQCVLSKPDLATILV